MRIGIGFGQGVALAAVAGASVGFFAVGGAATPSGYGAGPALSTLPKGAHAGECFSHVTTPAVYRTDHIPVASPPNLIYRQVPAVYRTVEKQVLVSPARVDHETIPEIDGTRVRYVDHPGADRVVEAPAVYRWEERRVQVRAAHLEWRNGRTAHGFGEGGGYGEGVSVRPTGEVMCRVLVPARYEVRRVRVLVTPARDCIVKGPTIHERIVEHIVVRPARTIDHPVAPVYRTVSEHVLVAPVHPEKIITPAAPHYVDKQVLVRPASTGWTRIACKVPAPAPHRYRPAPVYAPRPVPVRGGQCHTHTVCEDVPSDPVPYAAPRSGGYGESDPS